VSINNSGSLTAGAVNESYSLTFNASNGYGTYTWSHSGTALPPGLSFSSGGLLAGTPTALGFYVNETITVTDSLGGTA